MIAACDDVSGGITSSPAGYLAYPAPLVHTCIMLQCRTNVLVCDSGTIAQTYTGLGEHLITIVA